MISQNVLKLNRNSKIRQKLVVIKKVVAILKSEIIKLYIHKDYNNLLLQKHNLSARHVNSKPVFLDLCLLELFC